jgi:steroid 5-alpha reductase family enzyme
LTFNFWRKGGYRIGSEDYRWGFLRSRIANPVKFFAFNIFFISLFQPLVLLLVTSPTYALVVLSQLPEGATFGIPDLIFSRLLIFFVFIEIFADEQQWKFQSAKRLYLEKARIPDEYKDRFTAEDLDRGFVVSGLWSLCRHPNLAAEQSIWLTLYLWACYCANSYFHWTAIGAFSYILIIQGSTWLTESISAGKYQEYKEYQARVGKFIPRLSLEPRGKRRPAAEAGKKGGKKE